MTTVIPDTIISDLPIDAWMEILNNVVTSQKAALFACSCRAAALAYTRSKWPRVVRISRSRIVREPSTGLFDVTVTPGMNVQAAVNSCPRGGCVLLLAGMHEGPLVLTADMNVHIFGRGEATLWYATGDVISSNATTSTLDGVIILSNSMEYDHIGIRIHGGCLRLQFCNVTSKEYECIFICDGANPSIVACIIRGDKHYSGIRISGVNTRGTLNMCNISAGAVTIKDGANPTLTSCTIVDGCEVGVFIIDPGTTGFLEFCEISRNGGTGIIVGRGANPLLKSCVIHNNSSSGVMFDDNNTTGTMMNCEVYNNAVPSNDGVYIRDSSKPTIVGCNFHDNEIGVFIDYGAIVDDAAISLNCVFARNTKGNIVRRAPRVYYY